MRVLFSHGDQELVFECAENILKFKTALNQQTDNTGNRKLTKSKINVLLDDGIEQILSGMDGAIHVTGDGYIISGHHRQAALAIEVERGNIDLREQFLVIRSRDWKGRDKRSQLKAVVSNDTNRANMKDQLYNTSGLLKNNFLLPLVEIMDGCLKSIPNKIPEISVAVKRDVYKIATSLSTLVVAEGIRDQIDIYSVTGKDLYNANKLPASNLRKLVEKTRDGSVFKIETDDKELREKLMTVVSLLYSMRQSGLWDELFGNNKTFINILTSTALQGRMGVRDVKKVVKKIKQHGVKINNCLKLHFLNDPGYAEQIIIGYLFGG